MSPPKAWMAWSSGKDSAWALHVVRDSGEFAVVGLLTTVSAEFGRASMHSVRRDLIEAQARSLGLPLHEVAIPSPCPQETYDALMREALAEATAEGVSHVVFGDLFLEDVRQYREARTREAGLTAAFPLWKLDTTTLARRMIDAGLCAIVTCVDLSQAPAEMVGRDYDDRLLASLPSSVDPCGENGEFHTFARDGPMFATPLEVVKGEVVERDGFLFTDLLPAGVKPSNQERSQRPKRRRRASP